MNTEEKIIKKLVEIDAYLREKVVTKDELRQMKSDIMAHVDGFAKRQETFDVELAAMRSRVDRIDARLAAMGQRSGQV